VQRRVRASLRLVGLTGLADRAKKWEL
jgi:hypothetical protein